MSVVAIPPQPASPQNAKVFAGAFWPDIDLNDFRDTMRVGASSIPDPRLIAAIRGAIFTVTRDLSSWRVAQAAQGYETLKDVPSEPIGETDTHLTKLWQRAVYSYATADLTETQRDITATGTGLTKATEIGPSAADHSRNGLYAVRDILGVSRVTSELI